MKENTNMKNFTARFLPRQKQLLEKVAKERNTSPSAILRELVDSLEDK